MKRDIEGILADIYAAAPELKEREKELLDVIDALVKNRPDAEIDERFRTELRAELLSRFQVGAKTPRFALHLPDWSPYLASALAGGVFVAATIVVSMYPSMSNPPSSADKNLAAADRQAASETAVGVVTRLAAGAFGSLGGGQTLTAESISDIVSAPAGLGDGQRSGGGGAVTAPAAVATAMATPDMKMMPPNYESVRQEYAYSGAVPLPDGPVSVMKAEPVFDDSAITAVLSRSKIGPLDLRQMSQLKVDTLTVSEDRDWGYSITLNASDGGLYINQNWSRWPNSYACDPGKLCEPPAPLTMDQVPPSDELVAAAEKFLADFGLNRGDYGEPTVNDEWRIFYEQSIDQGYDYWIPDNYQVIFPMVIDGRTVYDESGNPQGLFVNVDARLLKVTQAGPFYLQRYLASDYEDVSDVGKVSDALKRGGLQAWSDPNATKIVTHSVGDPTEVLMVRYVWNGAVSQRLFVPALLFPLLNREAELSPDYWLPRAVVLPLTAELYDEATANGYPQPRPLMEPAAVPDAAETNDSPTAAQ